MNTQQRGVNALIDKYICKKFSALVYRWWLGTSVFFYDQQ